MIEYNNPFETEPLRGLVFRAAMARIAYRAGDSVRSQGQFDGFYDAAALVLWHQVQATGVHPTTFTLNDARAMVRGAVTAQEQILLEES